MREDLFIFIVVAAALAVVALVYQEENYDRN